MKTWIVTVWALFVCASVWAKELQLAEVTYCIESYNNDTQDFVIKAFGNQPEGAEVYFLNEFGATSGNRYNQIPRNREADFYLFGFEGTTLQKLNFALCSNNKQGSFGIQVLDGSKVLYHQRPKEFIDWYGRWVSKDLNTYVDLEIPFDEGVAVSTDSLRVRIYGGTSEGSVYLKAMSVQYVTENEVESPMGWVYEKLDKKSTLNAGDVVVLYRSGSAAGDYDGIETSHYLDAVAVNSISNLTETAVIRFCLDRDESGTHYTLTNQYGEKLGAKGKQNLAWDEGVQTWDIKIGYDGAEIASTNSNYGTIRYNVPSGSFARFWNYTSTSLALPYLYRRDHQLQPVVCTSLQMSAERTVAIDQDTVVARAKQLPSGVTDFRLSWSSSDTAVATVRDGIVELKTLGDAVITATSHDSGVSAQMTLHVVEATALETIKAPAEKNSDKCLKGGVIEIRRGGRHYDLEGRPMLDSQSPAAVSSAL